MERIVVRMALAVVCVGGVWLCGFALLAPDRPSQASAEVSAAALILLVATLLSMAAAQAWDRGARVRAVFGLLTVWTAAAVALLATLHPQTAPSVVPFLGTVVGAAFVAVILCGLAVVDASARDRWIGHVAGGAFLVAYGAYLLAVHGQVATDGVLHVGMAAYAAGLTATAAYSVRARQARLAARSSAAS